MTDEQKPFPKHLLHYSDARLHTPCQPFDFQKDGWIADAVAAELSTTKDHRKGYGLAAPQVGMDCRVFAFLDEVAFNPEILEKSSIEVLANEGCLSYPGLWVTVKRPKLVKVRYFDERQNEIIRDLDDLETRVFLHELDHLDGITMIDRASDLKLRRAIEQSNKHGQHYTFSNLRRL